ncbi:hypothetical protein H2200_002215 [Cladophialophora chaetospira]|uniref:Uncharacterized protein n=1 Tax=Cladophialophora chaetospira TaxID=386627 RepID=A0AA39CMV0_9EURO|nr:hypothetical protein H2200_002215 [Cladophialophora chaetospira]
MAPNPLNYLRLLKSHWAEAHETFTSEKGRIGLPDDADEIESQPHKASERASATNKGRWICHNHSVFAIKSLIASGPNQYCRVCGHLFCPLCQEASNSESHIRWYESQDDTPEGYKRPWNTFNQP